MASIRNEQGHIVVRWDGSDWLQGILPQSIDVGTNDVYGSGMDNMSLIDPYRTPGVLIPWFTASSVTNGSTVDTLPVASIRYSNKEYILSEASAGSVDLHEAAAGSVTNTGSFPREIVASGSGGVGGDVKLYYFNEAPYLIYSYNTASSGGNIGYYDLSSTFDDDWWTAVLSQSLNDDYPHPMFVSPRTGILYVADGSTLKFIDGKDTAIGDVVSGTNYGTSRLNLSEEFIITGFGAHPNYMVIFAYSRRVGAGSAPQTTSKGRPVAIFWDESTSLPAYIVELPGYYVGGGFTYKGLPATYTNDATKGYLCIVDTASYQVLTQIDSTASMTNGGVEVIDDDIFINLGGTVYRYGSPILGGRKILTDLASVTAGAVFNKNLSNGFSTYSNSALVRYGSGYVQSASALSAYVQLPPIFNGRYKLKGLKVYWKGTISSEIGLSSLQLRYDNQDAGAGDESFTNFLSTSFTTLDQRSSTWWLSGGGARTPFVERNIAFFVQWASSGATTNAIGIEAVEAYLEPTQHRQSFNGS